MGSECCGICKYRSYDGNDFICDNPDSNGFGDYSDFSDYCGEYEEK